MIDLRYMRGRLLALATLVPPDLDQETEEVVARLLEGEDEVGLMEVLGRLDLPEKARRKLLLIREAREVSLRLNEYARTLPLPHRKIEEGYRLIRRIKDEFAWLQAEP